MVLNFTVNKFENTVAGKLKAFLEGLIVCTVGKEGHSNFTIKPQIPNDSKIDIPHRTIWTIEKCPASIVAFIDPDIIKEYYLKSINGDYRIHQRPEHHDIFLKACIQAGWCNEEETKEIKTKLQYQPSQIKDYTSWYDRADDLMEKFEQNKKCYDESTAKLFMDVYNENKDTFLLRQILGNRYHDFKSGLETPKLTLIDDLREAGLNKLVDKALAGEYDD